jgi:hypothetical protein
MGRQYKGRDLNIKSAATEKELTRIRALLRDSNLRLDAISRRVGVSISIVKDLNEKEKIRVKGFLSFL